MITNEKDRFEYLRFLRKLLNREYMYGLSLDVQVSDGISTEKFDLADNKMHGYVKVFYNFDSDERRDYVDEVNKLMFALERNNINSNKTLHVVFDSNIGGNDLEYFNLNIEKSKNVSYHIIDNSHINELSEKYNIKLEGAEKEDKSETEIIDVDEKIINLINSGKNFYTLGNEKVIGQKKKSLSKGVWEIGINKKLTDVVKNVKVGDIAFLETMTINKDSENAQINAIGVITENPGDGEKLTVDWEYTKKIGFPIINHIQHNIYKVESKDKRKVLESLSQQLPEFFDILKKLGGYVSLPSALKESLSESFKISLKDIKTKQFWWINIKKDRWYFDSGVKIGDELSFPTHRQSGTKHKIFNHFFNVKKGDYCIGYQTGDTTRAILEITKEAVNRNLDEIRFRVVYIFKDKEQIIYSALKSVDLFNDSEVIKTNINGDLFKLTREEFEFLCPATILSKDIEETVTVPVKTGLNNDGAYTTKDLLNIENDVRSFALILASKDIKPPIAVALFGKWGSGKSFFMEHISKRVKELSKHQRFLEKGEDEDEIKETGKEKEFCKGIAQIKFNAWSYLDANLWAGLITTIFEKLDEFITGDNVKEAVKKEVHNTVSKKLKIVHDEKVILEKEIRELESDKKNIKDSLDKLKTDKKSISENVQKKTVEDLKNEAKKLTADIEDNVKSELDSYGISQQKLDEMSPASLLDEVGSWVTFVKNVGKFSPKSIVIAIIILFVLLFYSVDPFNWFETVKQILTSNIALFFGIAGPAFMKIYNSYSRYSKVLQPVINYKNEFNKAFETVKHNFEKEQSMLNQDIAQKQHEIEAKEHELTKVTSQIEEYEFEIKHSITRRAFNSFISRKSKGKDYEKHLGLISIIRKDFETLSALFEEVTIPGNIDSKERDRLEEKKKASDKFRGYFKKPLDRIILYIDDLDRCSDDKVLEVIQAVHLLMAFPLFNVVVGVDIRCLKNALIYRNLLQYNQFSSLQEVVEQGIHVISPDEYLEKIFQIPFQLEDPGDNLIKGMVDTFLKDQIEKEVTETQETTGKQEIDDDKKDDDKNDTKVETKTEKDEDVAGNNEKDKEEVQKDSKGDENEGDENIVVTPKDLELTALEVELLQEMAWIVGSNPRTIKRFINIYRIVRSHQGLKYSHNEKHKEFLSIMFILAINIGQYKMYAETLINCIEKDEASKLSEVLNKKELDDFKDLNKIVLRMAKTDAIREILQYPGSQFTKHIPLVGRFSFGEIQNGGE